MKHIEYLDLYRLFAFEGAEPDMGLAMSYLEATLECIEGAQAALVASSATPST